NIEREADLVAHAQGAEVQILGGREWHDHRVHADDLTGPVHKVRNIFVPDLEARGGVLGTWKLADLAADGVGLIRLASGGLIGGPIGALAGALAALIGASAVAGGGGPWRLLLAVTADQARRKHGGDGAGGGEASDRAGHGRLPKRHGAARQAA